MGVPYRHVGRWKMVIFMYISEKMKNDCSYIQRVFPGWWSIAVLSVLRARCGWRHPAFSSRVTVSHTLQTLPPALPLAESSPRRHDSLSQDYRPCRGDLSSLPRNSKRARIVSSMVTPDCTCLRMTFSPFIKWISEPDVGEYNVILVAAFADLCLHLLLWGDEVLRTHGRPRGPRASPDRKQRWSS